MLGSFPELRTRSRDEIETVFRLRENGEHVDLPGGRVRSSFVANAVRFDDATLVYSRYAAPVSLGFAGSDGIRLAYYSGSCARIVDGRRNLDTSEEAGVMAPAGRPWRLDAPAGYEVLAIWLSTAALQRKLDALTGDANAAIDLRQPRATPVAHALRIRARVFDLASDLEAAGPKLAARLGAEANEAIFLDVLEGLNETLLKRRLKPAAPSALQIGHVEQ